MRVGSGGKVSLSKGSSKSANSATQRQDIDSAALAASQGRLPEKIEERVFLIPGMKDAEPPAIFATFIEEIAPKLGIAATSRSILKEFSNIDVNAEKLSQCIKANPYYEFQFLRVIESLSKREELPGIESAVVLLGMQNSRDLIIALQCLRAVNGGHPEWGSDGKLKVVPKDILKYALKTEEALAGNKEGFADTAFAAGLVFDMLLLLAREMAEDKKVAAYVDTVYNHGLRSAKVAMEMARFVPDFTYKKFAFSAALLHDVGKIALAILAPDYLSFLEECAKKNYGRAMRMAAERKRFGIDHAALGGLCCYSFPIFRVLERAVLFHHEPFLLKSNRKLFLLSNVVSISTNVANYFKKIDKADDPILSVWLGGEHKGFKFGARELMMVVNKAVESR